MASKSSFFSQTGPSPTLQPVAVNIPVPIVGSAGYFIRINLAGTDYETQTPAQVQTAIGLPSPVIGIGAQYLRVNAGGTAYEVRTTAQTQADIGLPVPSGGNPTQYLRVNAGATAYEARTQAQTQADLWVLPHGQCQLQFVSSTSLKLAPYNGNFIRIQGAVYAIPSAGVTITNGSLAASTLYYAYLFNNAGTLTLELSATTHATDATAGNVGVEIKSGDASRTLVGMIKTNGSSQFQDDSSNRLVASWFNRRNRTLSGASSAAATTSSTTFVEVNNASRVTFLTWADEGVSLHVSGSSAITAGAGFIQSGMGIDATNASTTLLIGNATTSSQSAGQALSTTLSEGSHFGTPIGLVSVGTVTGLWTVQMEGTVRG